MKQIRISEFQNFNQILEIYRKSLNIFLNSFNGKFDSKKMNELLDPKYRFSFISIVLMNEFTKIENLYENKQVDEHSWNRRIKRFNLTPPFVNIKVEGISNDDMTLSAFLKKFKFIRNCIAHGRYYLSINNENGNNDIMNKCSIVFDDPTNTVQGSIPFYNIFNISNDFTFILQPNYDNRVVLDDIDSSIKNPDRFLDDCIKRIRVASFNKKSFRLLTKEEKSKLRAYSSIVGKSEMRNYFLRYISRKHKFNDAFDSVYIGNFLDLLKRIIFDNNSPVFNSNNYNMFLGSIYSSHGEDMSKSLYSSVPFEINRDSDVQIQIIQLLFKEMISNISKERTINFYQETMYMYRPFLYTEGLTSMLNYMVGYIRECNINYNKNLFKFTIDPIDIKIEKEDSSEPSIVKINPGQKIQNEINELVERKKHLEAEINYKLKLEFSKKGNLFGLLKIGQSKSIDNKDLYYIKIKELFDFEQELKQQGEDKINYEDTINRLNEFLIFFEENGTLTNIYPQIMIRNISKNISELKNLYTKLMIVSQDIAIKKIEYERIKYEPSYIDYSGLFRHIRNAIVHSNVKVNYASSKKSKNLDDIEYTFEDYKKNVPDCMTFKATLTGRELLHLMELLQNSINSQVEQSKHNKKFENMFLHESIVSLGINSSELSVNSINGIEPIQKEEK